MPLKKNVSVRNGKQIHNIINNYYTENPAVVKRVGKMALIRFPKRFDGFLI